MKPDELAARSHELAAANDRAVLQVLAEAGDTGLGPGRELAELVALSPSTTRHALGRLIARGLARRDGKRRVWATPAGRSEAGAGTPGVSLAPTLDAAIGCFPSETLRGFVRLQLAAVIARWHLAGQHSAGWPGFIALGPTKTGKTSIAALIARVFGLEELQAIKAAFRETPGSLVGRRERDSRSATGWRVERSPTLALPFVCIDEWDKTTRDVQQAAGGLLLGATADELEGERFELRPTVYVTLNTGPAGLRALDAAHLRRSVVLDTTPLLPLLSDLDQDMWQLFDSGQVAIPRLRLEQLRPRVTALPAELRELLRAELRAGLTDDGLRHSDVEPLARIALGRAALADGPLEPAVIATVYDYLLCADTLGQARDGYASRLVHQLDDGALAPNPDAARAQRQQLLERRLGRELERALDRDRLVEERGRLAQMLSEAIARLDLRRLRDCSPQQRVDARGITERLREVHADVTSARSREVLEGAGNRARDPLRRAGELLEQIGRDQQARREIAARTAPVQRSRRPELAPARGLAGLISALLPGAHGPALDALNHQAQQLEQTPPASEAERRKAIEQLQAREVHNARMVNPFG